MITPKQHNKNYKRKLSATLTTSGLGLFLIFGFTGCNSNNDCDKNGLYDSKEDCKKSNILGGGSSTSTNSSSSHSSSGFFAPIASHGSTSHGFSSGG